MNLALIRVSTLLLLIVLGNGHVHATHNRAGEINYVQTGDLSIRATIITYTKTSSVDADRDSLLINWGDGTSQFVLRSNGQGDPIDNDIKINFYIAEHNYPNQGRYTIYVQDPNRVANILNVNFPNSVNVPFYLETTFTFLNTEIQGFNNSAILLQPPIDFACTNQVFKHNPNAFDPDGDSLSFELAVPGQDVGIDVPDYSFPDEIAPGLDNLLNINPVTGELTWRTPKLQGEYNVAIRVNEYRQGNLISSMIRDMQIFVIACDNRPPEITAIDEICVIAGETIDIPIVVNDPDPNQKVQITASGGPFFLEEQTARLEATTDFVDPTLNARFVWETSCDQISEQYYQVVFRAVDDGLNSGGLADLHTLRIKVVGPPPEEVEAESLSDQIKVSWALPYECEFTNNDFFIGFSVWRRQGSLSLPMDSCATGLEGRGYEKFVFLTNENDGNEYFIFDDDVEKGITYCYRVVAEFAQQTASGNIFNRAASLPSDEICMQIFRDIPLMTRVSVVDTDQNAGRIDVAWTKPLAADLDTLENPGPYRYELLRSIADQDEFSPVPGADFTVDFFNSSVDTFFTDSDLNTTQQQFDYQINFYASQLDSPYGTSKSASSVFLNISGSDRRNELSWSFDVPWDNVEYEIERFDTATGSFESLATTDETSYSDLNLDNDTEYCYRVLAIGTYGISGIDDPLLNYSQERCAIPIDNEGPCAPSLSAENVCSNPDDFPGDNFFDVRLDWTMPDIDCGDIDLAGYNIYFSSTENVDLSIIETISDGSMSDFSDQRLDNITGCYAVSAFDINGNEGELSNTVCVEICPIYELGNAFTPNNDQTNDLFVPRANRFIASVDMKIFNQWGNLVYETSDPMINWDGTNQNGQELAEGVYYYSCNIFPLGPTIGFEQAQSLSGFIHLVRN